MRRISKSRIVPLVLLAIGLSACAADGTLQLPAAAFTPYPPPGYTHHVGNAHVDLYWNCMRPEPGILQVAGLAFNPWGDQPILFLEFEFVGVGGNERTVSSAKTEARDLQLLTGQSTPFQLDLKTAGSEARFDLYYQYRFQEGDHNRIVAGPFAGGRFLLAQATQRFMVRDACSESQHRVR